MGLLFLVGLFLGSESWSPCITNVKREVTGFSFPTRILSSFTVDNKVLSHRLYVRDEPIFLDVGPSLQTGEQI